MDLASFITGIGPTAGFSPGSNTPPPFNVTHTGLTDGTDPTTASVNQAEVYNRLLLAVASVIVQAGISIDHANWTQLATAVQTIANNAVSSAGLLTVSQYNSDSVFGSGYVRLGRSKYVLQFGSFAAPGGGGFLNISLPINYTSSVFGGIAVSADASAVLAVASVSTSVLRVQNGGGTGYFFTIGSMA